ncbi:phosphoribosylamine--glycine ligase [Proteiniclasticum sp.]|uniref:phosphoribosylamine--glycine ligase n=1 Tax=Proteiniclasticum sp. TaxID=2053595 RepID=UPI00289EEE52|nr:phosphoribosylamine--glycine ligase [Proteiniclasticum sp.]
MKILIVGEGAREHAIAAKLAKSDQVKEVYVSPGNGGTQRLEKCMNIPKESHFFLRDFALQNHIDYTVVGPEADLMEGIVDLFLESGLRIIGPQKACAILEGSKSFAKDFMKKYGIRTAQYQVFTDSQKARSYVSSCRYPIVIKADGLASGKGVEIIHSLGDAIKTIEEYMENGKFHEASRKIVIEEYLEGKEASIITLFDGERIIPLNSTMDHKKIGEGETGLNTGGMGSLTPNPYYTEEIQADFRENIMKNTLEGLIAENMRFKGVIFFGLMLTDKGSYLLEYNLRFGDPETQSLLETLSCDLNTIFMKTLDGCLIEEDVICSNESALCVVLSSKCYPLSSQEDIVITDFFDQNPDAIEIFSYSSRLEGNDILSRSGRVLSVVSRGTEEEIQNNVYGYLQKVGNENLYYRSDIGRI